MNSTECQGATVYDERGCDEITENGDFVVQKLSFKLHKTADKYGIYLDHGCEDEPKKDKMLREIRWGTTAQRAGLQAGDVIIRINDVDMSEATCEAYLKAVRMYPHHVELTVLRTTNAVKSSSASEDDSSQVLRPLILHEYLTMTKMCGRMDNIDGTTPSNPAQFQIEQGSNGYYSITTYCYPAEKKCIFRPDGVCRDGVLASVQGDKLCIQLLRPGHSASIVGLELKVNIEGHAYVIRTNDNKFGRSYSHRAPLENSEISDIFLILITFLVLLVGLFLGCLLK